MRKLIKAEFFRATHSGIYFPLFVIVGLMILAFPFASGLSLESDFFEAMTAFGSSSMAIAMFVPLILSVMIGNMFNNRTYYYEIMDGSCIHHIILSKVIVYSVFSGIVLLLPNIVLYTFLAIKNGLGDGENVWLVLLVGVVAIIHLTCNTIFISLIIRNMVGSAILNFMSLEIISMSYMMISEVNRKSIETIDMIFDWFSPMQLMHMAQMDYSDRYIFTVIFSFVVEFVVLYIITYISYRKKNFK